MGKNIRNWIYRSYLVVFFRKILNTFRPMIWFCGKFYNVKSRVVKDASLWVDETYYDSDFYLTLGKRELYFIDFVIKNTDYKDKILDICCNQGRFLFELKRQGYSNLFGFDIMSSAIKKMKLNEKYNPNVFLVENALAQDYFKDKDNEFFDWAITYTATIELINPEFDIFSELKRTVKKGMFLVVNENGHTYPRFYRLLHRINGFYVKSVIRISENTVLIHSERK